jgi:hypothetical protein
MRRSLAAVSDGRVGVVLAAREQVPGDHAQLGDRREVSAAPCADALGEAAHRARGGGDALGRFAGHIARLRGALLRHPAVPRGLAAGLANAWVQAERADQPARRRKRLMSDACSRHIGPSRRGGHRQCRARSPPDVTACPPRSLPRRPCPRAPDATPRPWTPRPKPPTKSSFMPGELSFPGVPEPDAEPTLLLRGRGASRRPVVRRA